MKLVSIIIPAWQSAETLPRTLETLLAQTYPALEIIVVDDGSTDRLEDALVRFRGRITYHKLTQNSGAPHARNVGFSLAHGELVMFADADLIFEPDAIKKLAAALEAHPEASFAYPSFNFGWKRFRCGPYDVAKLKKKNFIHTSALLRRRAAVGFDESLKRFQDWDLWLTLAEQGKTGVWVPEALYRALPRLKHLGISSWLPAFWYEIPWAKIGWVPKSIRKYEAAANIVCQKHGLPTSLEPSTGARVAWRCLEFLAALEVGSALAYFYPTLQVPFFSALVAAVFLIALRNLGAGFACLGLEMMVGSHGHMLDLPAPALSIRMGFFLAILAAYFFQHTQLCSGRSKVSQIPKRYFLLYIMAAYGLAIAWLRGRDLSIIVNDGNAYGFLLLAIPLFDGVGQISWSQARAVALTGFGWLTAKTFLILYMFSHFGPEILRPLYLWVRDTRVAEVTRFQKTVFFRVFLQSHLALLVVASRVARSFSFWGLVLVFALTLVSLSRSLTVGIAAGVTTTIAIMMWKRLMAARTLTRGAVKALGAVVVAVVFLTVIVNFPLPYRGSFFSLGAVFSERYADLGDEAISSRWELLGSMMEEIKKHPLLGWGFGKSVTYISKDPRILTISPDGRYTTTAFEWGYLDLWLKFGLLGVSLYAAYLALVGQLLYRLLRVDPKLGALLIGSFVGLLVTNIFTPYLNHPLGFALLLVIDFVAVRKMQGSLVTDQKPSSPASQQVGQT